MANDNYQNLLVKVDETFARLKKAAGDQVNCRAGCHSCCRPQLTVAKVEREHIRLFLQDHPEVVNKLKTLEASNPHRGTRCALLDAEGFCSIYPVRPIICRSHGVAVRYQENDQEKRSACELNYKDRDVAELPVDAVLNLDLLNTMLALIGEQEFKESAKKRYLLKVSELLED